ncbi:MAG: DUF6166 domain-containing protein [Gammaproteobacteria bacterium]
MKVYHGTDSPSDGIRLVRVDGRRPLPLRLDLRNHSPDGFAWGYGGSGPAQLALALLCDHLGDEQALEFYQDFKWRVIAGLPGGGEWTLSSADIDVALAEIRAERASGAALSPVDVPF